MEFIRNNRTSIHLYLFLFFSITYLISIIYAKFLLSISLWAFAFLVIIEIAWGDIKWKKNHLPYLFLPLIFLSIVFSGINSEDIGKYMHHLKIKIPFLILPFVWSYKQAFFAKYYLRFSFLFLLIIVFSAFPVLIEYYQNYDQITESIKKGHPIPTPLEHIKYAICISLAIIISGVLWIKNFTIKKYNLRPVLLAALLFLFVFQHILSVRTGLILTYIALPVLGGKYLHSIGRTRFIPFVIGLIMLAPISAYFTLDSFKTKVHYVRHDFKQMMKAEGEHYSDGGRLLSYKAAIPLIKESPFLGTGIGDLENEMIKSHKMRFNSDSRKYPHNQFMFYLTGTGIIGLFIFLIGIFGPIWYFRYQWEGIFILFQLIILVSCLVENTLERYQPIALFLFFTLSGIAYMLQKKESSVY